MDAKSIIAALGGREPVAAATGADRNTVGYWERRDRIPADRWDGILRLAGEVPDCSVTIEVLVKHLGRSKAVREQASAA